jgi:hypothetical protein
MKHLVWSHNPDKESCVAFGDEAVRSIMQNLQWASYRARPETIQE